MANHKSCMKMAVNEYSCGGSVYVYAQCMANGKSSPPSPYADGTGGTQRRVKAARAAVRKYGRSIERLAKKACKRRNRRK